MNKLQIRVKNMSKKPNHLPKRMYAGVEFEVSNRNFSLSRELETLVNVIPHYKEREKEVKLGLYRDVTHQD